MIEPTDEMREPGPEVAGVIDVNGNVWAHLSAKPRGAVAWNCGRVYLNWHSLIEFNGPVRAVAVGTQFEQLDLLVLVEGAS